jgi:hypothetical protein
VNHASKRSSSELLCAPSGDQIFGFMPNDLPEHKWEGRPIKLEYGYPGPQGYGYAHVISYEGRIKHFQRLGYPSFEAFAAHVACNYSHVYFGKEPGRYQLACHVPGYTFFIVVQWNEGCQSWTITTGLPSRRIKEEPIWVRKGSECEPPPAVPEPNRRFTTLSLSPKSDAQEH